MADQSIFIETEMGRASHGLVIGSMFQSERGSVFETKPFCQFNCEKVYLWQPTISNWNDTVWFLTELISDPAAQRPWKTFSTALKIAQAYQTFFEGISDHAYWWMPKFEFGKVIEPPSYVASELGGTIIFRKETIECWYPILELVLRDSEFFNASLLLINSFEQHYSCMMCELDYREHPDKKHNHPEPESWQEAQHLTFYEPAVVQAMRAMETIVGEPVNINEMRNLWRFEKRWQKAGIDRRTEFKRMNQTMIEAFIDLYSSFRNPSAHGYKLDANRLERIEVIDVQALATSFLLRYLDANSKSWAVAADTLKADHSLIEDLFKRQEERWSR